MSDALKSALENILRNAVRALGSALTTEEIDEELQDSIARKQPELSAMRCTAHPEKSPVALRCDPQTGVIAADICGRCFSIWTEAMARASEDDNGSG